MNENVRFEYPFTRDGREREEDSLRFGGITAESNGTTLAEFARMSHENAHRKGFYDRIISILENPHLTEEDKKFIRYLWRVNRLMLITSELGEALEGLRHNNLSGEPKSGGFLEEIADAFIRMADLCGSEGFDLEAAVKAKQAYNSTREHMHGGKVA